MQSIDFYKLTRSVQERFIGSTNGTGLPAPMLRTNAPPTQPFIWFAVSAISTLTVFLIFRLGFGDLTSGFAVQGLPWLLGDIGLIALAVFGVIRALDPHGLTRKWEFKMNDITWAGVMTTASDVLFGGGKEGYFLALDARSGDLLWKIALGGQINSGPMTYSVNGKQYVTVAAGSSLFAFALK